MPLPPRFSAAPARLLTALLLGALAACAPEPERQVADLVEDFPFAEVSRERPRLDLGAPEAREALGAGWSWDGRSADGTTFVWAVDDASEVTVYLSRARELTVRMRCWPFHFPGAPDQVVEVSWDGEPVAELTLPPGPSVAEFTVPASRAVPGVRRLRLVPAYAREARATVGGDDPRRLSFACDWIEVGQGPPPEAPRGEGDVLWIPVGTELVYYLEPEGEQRLRWDALSFRGGEGSEGGSLDVVFRRDGEDAHTVTVTEAEGGSLALPSPDGEPLALVLRAAGDGGPGSGAVLRRPRLTAPATDVEPASPDADVEEADVERVELPSTAPRPPILLWVVDTLRTDRLGVYGHDRPTSPRFDALAERSTIFDRAVAQSSWTRPTMATLLTGVGAERHGIAGVEHGLDPSFVTLAEHLQQAGYVTLGFSSNGNFSDDTGMDQGFDHFEYRVTDAPVLAARALEKVDEATATSPDRPFFLTVLTVEPHASFEPAEPFRERLAADVDDPYLGTAEHIRALGDKKAPADDRVVRSLFELYDAEIAWNDHVFGELLDALEERQIEPVIVVVADHGEAFRERGVFGHGWDLHREVLHIPLWIHVPGQEAGRRVLRPVQQADLLPTLLDLLELPVPEDVDGHSLAFYLAPSVRTPPPAPDRILVSTMDYEGRAGASLVRGPYKLIEPLSDDFAPGRLLYDLENDPLEQHDLSAERPVTAGRLARLLREHLASRETVEAQEVELDPETRKQLEALGYLN